MQISLAHRVKIVLEALLDGRFVQTKIAGIIYKIGMSENYEILVSELCFSGVVWHNTNMQVSLFLKVVKETDESEIRRLAVENAFSRLKEKEKRG